MTGVQYTGAHGAQLPQEEREEEREKGREGERERERERGREGEREKGGWSGRKCMSMWHRRKT